VANVRNNKERAMTLSGKRIVVLGGSSGIGLATAQAAARDGANVVIASSSKDRIEAIKRTWRIYEYRRREWSRRAAGSRLPRVLTNFPTIAVRPDERPSFAAVSGNLTGARTI
jgi:NAD(P)-dependent dehydrogenase (short-subunit alcohol dehydrogenase family)